MKSIYLCRMLLYWRQAQSEVTLSLWSRLNLNQVNIPTLTHCCSVVVDDEDDEDGNGGSSWTSPSIKSYHPTYSEKANKNTSLTTQQYLLLHTSGLAIKTYQNNDSIITYLASTEHWTTVCCSTRSRSSRGGNTSVSWPGRKQRSWVMSLEDY